MSLKRTLGMIALACTGIGAIYMLARTRWVKPKCVGVVLNYATGEYESLEPGANVILNPFRWYVAEVSTQTQVKRLNPFTVKSLDNVDANVQADVTYEVTDPLALYRQVSDPQSTFTEQVRAAFSSAIQTLNFTHVTSAEINRLAKEAGHHDNTDEKNKNLISAPKTKEGDGIIEAQLIQDGANFLSVLLNSCVKWGIKILNFRIITIEAKHKRVSEALELTAEAEVNAKAQLKAAKSQADTIRMLAAAEKDAQLIRAEGAARAAQELKDGKCAMNLYSQETNVRTAQALGGKNNLIIGLNHPNDLRLSDKICTTFARQNSLDDNDENQPQKEPIPVKAVATLA